MPTSRTLTFLIAAFVLYLFANQTQVGWLYVMSALLAGLVGAGWWLNRNAARGVTAERHVGGVSDEQHEGDTVTVGLTLRATSRKAHLRVVERCPLVADDDPFHAARLFVPTLPAGGAVRFDYDVTLDRRGLHEYPPLDVRSRAPFGFFERAAAIHAPTRVLVYPEVQRLTHLDLLDRRNAPQMTRPRAGAGYEVLGVRPYRADDSPRHIHWRSVARAGELISKEFSDESQPGVTLILDLFAHPYPVTSSKHTPFEWGVKAAASIADYATNRHYPVYLLADSRAMAVPPGAVSQTALLQYLARVQPTSTLSLADVLRGQPTQALAAVILPYPDRAAFEGLCALKLRGVDVLAVLPDPASFPAGGESASALANELTAAGIEVRVLKFGEPLSGQLSDETTRQEMAR